MKGYKTSKNYRLLWKLISDKHRIPGWIPRKFDSGRTYYDLVEVRMDPYGRYSIGTRGIGYETFDKTEAAFINNCKSIGLKFVKPVLT